MVTRCTRVGVGYHLVNCMFLLSELSIVEMPPEVNDNVRGEGAVWSLYKVWSMTFTGR